MLVHVGIFTGGFAPWYKQLFAQLDIGVPFFFLLSGFLLYRPMLAARREDCRGRRSGYARNRFVRIMPAYWVVLTVAAIVPGIAGPSPTTGGSTTACSRASRSTRRGRLRRRPVPVRASRRLEPRRSRSCSTCCCLSSYRRWPGCPIAGSGHWIVPELAVAGLLSARLALHPELGPAHRPPAGPLLLADRPRLVVRARHGAGGRLGLGPASGRANRRPSVRRHAGRWCRCSPPALIYLRHLADLLDPVSRRGVPDRDMSDYLPQFIASA